MRPWSGQTEDPAPQAPSYDPGCYLCPGNERANGHRNPQYASCYVFDNDFPALLPDRGNEMPASDSLLVAQPVSGQCRVVCYSPDHSKALADLSAEETLAVVETWRDQWAELSSNWAWVQVFENKGEAMGCSNPHPHGQIWASDTVPTLVAREAHSQADYWKTNGRTLLGEVLRLERESGDRIVVTDDHWSVVVPFWATWPFETLVLPHDPVATFGDMTPDQCASLARTLWRLTRTYDRLFDCPFPYSMGWHGSPSVGSDGWVLHAHFYPPLLRSATVRKHMVGYEMLAEAQRDVTPEWAATRLRDVAATL